MAGPDPSASKLKIWAERLVALLDDRFRIPGTELRFGLDPIIGILFPGLGDAVTGAGSIGLLALALRRGVPRIVILRMVLNIAIDALAGSLPFVGDVFDVAFKANRRNLDLLIEHEAPGSKATPWDYAVVILGVSVAILSIVIPLAVALYLGLNYGPALLDCFRHP
jgi:hypothetical protein